MEATTLKPKYIVIHHSATKDGVLKDFDAIRRYHIEVNGWNDIGYHLVIEQLHGRWECFTGRSELEFGAHCKEAGMNRQSIGICMVGNFDVEPPPLEGLLFLRDICSQIVTKYAIPTQNVIGHRDAGLMVGFDWRKGQYKSCPGKLFPIAGLQTLLSAKLETMR